MPVLEIIGILSAATSVATGCYRIIVAIRSNKYAANFARISQMNQHERGKFTEIIIPKRTATIGHSHGASAAARSAGSSACATYALANNKIPFYMSMSASDQRADRKGDRVMHWAKDFNAEPRSDEPDSNSVIVMVDVDYHVEDLPSKLHNYHLPTIMYTFQPSVASGVFQDYRFTFNKKNEVVYNVCGGAYTHKVWDYSPDTIVVRKKFLGLTYAKSFFTVEKRYVDENHQIVLLTPLAKFGLLGSLLSYNVQGTDLKRLEPVQGEFIRMDVARSIIGTNKYEHKTSTSRVDDYNSATVDIAQDNAIAATARSSSEKLNIFQIKSLIPGMDHVATLALLEYHRQKKSVAAPRLVIPTDAVNNYTFNPTATTLGKPSEVPFMAPIIPECYAPTVSIENDKEMIKGRIADLMVAPDHLDEKHMKYGVEFVKILKKELGELEPFDFEQVNDKLNRPSQRRITEEASYFDYVSDLIKSFMKKEAYQKITTARPIATINGKVKFEYSQFTHAVSEALKKTKFYAFGRKPKQISELVSAICQVANTVTNTDLSRFDGRVNKSARQFDELVMMALFPEKYHKKMLELMKKQYGKSGVTSLGVKYKNGFNRQSGSPETAILNTLLNVFMAYICIRETGLEPAEAYAKLGVYGGDDGLTPDVDPKLYTEVCARFGQVLEAEVIKRGEKGVSFLARIYSPDVWSGSPHNCADIARAASKIHVSTACDVTAVEKLFEKAYALCLTDANTPIIGPFVQRAVELSGKGVSDYKNLLNIWNSTLDVDDQYPNDNHDGWMYTVVEDQKLTGFDTSGFNNWLAECKSLDDMLKCPSFIDKLPHKLAMVPVKLNGDLLLSNDEMTRQVAEYMRLKQLRDASLNNPQIIPQTTFDAIPTTAKFNPVTTISTMVPIVPVRASVPVHTGPGLRDGNSGSKQSAGGSTHNSRGPRTLRYTSGPGYYIRTNGNVATILSAKSHKSGQTNSRTWKKLTTNNTTGGRCGVTVPAPRLVGIELNPGPLTSTDKTWLDHEIKTTAEVDAAMERMRNQASNQATRTPPRHAHEGDDWFAKNLFVPLGEAIETVQQYFDVKPTINGNNGSATNSDDHSAPTKGPLSKLKQEIKKEAKLIAKSLVTNQKGGSRRGNPSQPRAGPTLLPIVTAPVSAARGNRTGAPRIFRNSLDRMTIGHSELINIVSGTTAFSSAKVPMQPGLNLMTWLSTQTSGWEQYRWVSLTARYETRTGTNVPGSVMLVADYDAADPAPTSEIAASTYHGTEDDAPWKEIKLKFKPQRQPLYIRNGPLAANLDIKTYDFANLFICTVDGTAVNWGKVFIDYEIELINAHVINGGLGYGGTVTGSIGTTTANMYGTAPIVANGSFIVGVDQTGVITLSNMVVGDFYVITVASTGVGFLSLSNGSLVGLALRNNVVDDAINGSTKITDTLTVVATAQDGSFRTTSAATSVSNTNCIFSRYTNTSPL